ncbi:MAG TPA: cysteine desulfurase family protein [Planktothrix sp.]|jgi:cysteine desulfurase
MTSMIYLDNSATTFVRDEVRQAMVPFQSDSFGNGSSIHQLGLRARLAIEKARVAVANLLNAQPEEIFFTPCATYSNNVALLGRARYVEENGLGRHVITTPLEHSSALGPIQHLASRGWHVSYVNVDRDGLIDLNHLKSLLTYETSIISVMWGNNEIGSLQPIAEIGSIAAQKGIYFHSDAVQVAGKLPLDVKAANVDTLSISGHKFHAPKGIGALYIKKGAQILPIIFGGGQENGLFPGTENVANIVGLGKAAEVAQAEMGSHSQRLERLQKILIDKLLRNPNIALTGPRDLAARVPGHVSVVIKGAGGPELVEEIDSRGICVSSVSACSSKSGHPSHVLKSIGYSADEARGSLRITAGILNTEEEVTRAAAILCEILAPKTVAPAFQQFHSALIA